MVSVRRVAPLLLLAMMVAAPVLAQRSSSRPPRELHRVGDHWTAYNPPDPSTYAPNAKTHAIAAGDTLWSLAQKYFGNGYLWPQLWESNTWITDAHWIYPGDVLLVEGEAMQNADATGSATGGGATTEGETQLAGGLEDEQQDSGAVRDPNATANVLTVGPIALASERDVYCYGYIGDVNEPMPNHIASFEDVETHYQPGRVTQVAGGSQGDLVYVDGGTSTGLVAGETYILVEPGEKIYHPRTKELIGRNWEYRGQLRILCADESRARGIITQSCTEIHMGARLKPLPQIPIPIARVPDMPGFCDNPSGKRTGTIIDAFDYEFNLGEGNLIQIDLGRDDAIAPGDFLTVFRESPIAGQPRQILGEIGILTTEAHTATAKIMASRRSMTIGDYVELR